METTPEFLTNFARSLEGVTPHQAWQRALEMLESAPPVVRAALEEADAEEKKRIERVDDFPAQLDFLKKLVEERDQRDGDDWKRGDGGPV